jgi:hypothetical protein
MPGGAGERALKEIASKRGEAGTRNTRKFGPWLEIEPGILRCNGSVLSQSGKEFRMDLVLGKKEGLFLSEVAGSKHSLRHVETGSNGFKIDIGKELPDRRISDLANQVVSWVIHGNFWENRPGNICNHPYGDDPNRPVNFFFKVTDGGAKNMTLRQFLEADGIRSSHVGNWRPHTLVAAACGVPVTLHEFTQNSDRTATFRGHHISKDPDDIWGPYTRMNPSGVASNGFGSEISHIARAAASPFAFHLHATRLNFPNTVLESANLIEKLGMELLERTIAGIAAQEPERFYRLIDERGRTHRLDHTTSTNLVFEGGEEFPIVEIVENVEQTLQELSRVQDDPGFDLPRIKRVVPDTHFYAVVSGLAQAGGAPILNELSGSEMYRYLLTDEGQSLMHRVRNERLFRIARDIVGADQLELAVFPPIVTNVQEDQYSLDLATFDKERWLSQKLGA